MEKRREIRKDNDQKKQRRYLGFRYKGKPSELITIISQKVNEYDLSKLIPLLRVEKQDKSQQDKRRKPEFYFFVAIEGGDNPQLEQKYQEFKEKILVLPFFKCPAIKGYSCFTYSEIKPMVGAAHDVLDYTNPIPYPELVEESLENDNPFFIDISVPNPLINTNDENYQKLLYWLSAVGCSSWQLFKQTCQILDLDNPQRILRRLKLLGHLETFSDGKKNIINPTTLVQIDSDTEEEFILCGQQNGNLIKKLERFGTISYRGQPLKNAPVCVKFKSNILTKIENIENIITEIKNNHDVQIYQAGLISHKLADALPDLQEWYKNLGFLQGIVTSLYEWRQFDGNIFIECLNPQETGMYQMFQSTGQNKQENSNLCDKQPIRTVFYDADTQSFKQGDWYGLRFLALKKDNQNLIVKYDKANKCLAIPYSQRWPELYERTLVLASGMLPTYQKTEEENLCLVYENISSELLTKLTDKLELNWQQEETECMM